MDNPDIVEWAENWLGIQLFEYQKEILGNLNFENKIFVMPRHKDKFSFEIALAHCYWLLMNPERSNDEE